MRVAAVALVITGFLSGCIVGGGPMIAFRRHTSPAIGVEIGAGAPYAQVTAGYQIRPGIGYTRLDYTVDPAGSCKYNNTRSYPAGRIGGGVAIDRDGAHGMVALGGGYSSVVAESSERYNTVAMLQLEVRYLREWQLVIAPRLEIHHRTAPQTLPLVLLPPMLFCNERT